MRITNKLKWILKILTIRYKLKMLSWTNKISKKWINKIMKTKMKRILTIIKLKMINKMKTMKYNNLPTIFQNRFLVQYLPKWIIISSGQRGKRAKWMIYYSYL